MCRNDSRTDSFPPRIKHGVNSSGNPGVVPAKVGNQCFAYWVPPYQVRGRLSQARNDKLCKIYVGMYKREILGLRHSVR